MQQVTIQRIPAAGTAASSAAERAELKENADPVATVSHARHFFTRLRGLLGKKHLAANSGILLTPCSQVHTVGMRVPLDVVFLTADGVVLKCVPHLPPWRAAGARGAKHTLELAADSVRRLGLRTGDRLRWDTVNKR